MHKTGKRWSIYVWTCLVIILGFVAVAASNRMVVSQIVNDDLQKSTRLMTANIYSAIQSELGKTTVVTKTMAADTFLVQWLQEEKNGNKSGNHRKEVEEYLQTMKEKNGYSSAYLISEFTKEYYNYQGKKMIVRNYLQKDWWYYRFVNARKSYELRVGSDELSANAHSVFINARIDDEDNNLLGVVGVAIPMHILQDFLRSYGEEYDMQACLVNTNGIAEVEADSGTERENIFEKWNLDRDAQKILMQQDDTNTWIYNVDGTEHCIVSVYIEELDWYLFIHEIGSGAETLRSLTDHNFLIMVILLAILLFLNVFLIYLDNKKLTNRMSVDALTGLPNRNYFFDTVLPKAALAEGKIQYLVIFDIDRFKTINDTRGHNVGDEMLKFVANTAREVFRPYGKLVRWGGDEFIVLVQAGRAEIESAFAEISKKVLEENITLSMGAVRYEKQIDIMVLIDRADQALYQKKRNGRNGLVFYEK